MTATQAPIPLPEMTKPQEHTTRQRPGKGRHNIRVGTSCNQLMGAEVRHLKTSGLEGRIQLHFQLDRTYHSLQVCQ